MLVMRTSAWSVADGSLARHRGPREAGSKYSLFRRIIECNMMVCADHEVKVAEEPNISLESTRME